MTSGKWLFDQPKTWHDINRALHDIAVLLEFLGTTPDSRLLSYFQDTQGQVADGAAKRTVPPCATYAEFLDVIFKIGAAFQTGREDMLPTIPSLAGGGTPLSHTSFVYWSRDFLASVAAPATAESIRLTHEYVVLRARRSRWFAWWRRGAGKAATERAIPDLPPDVDRRVRKMLARRLARWAWFSEYSTFALVIITVVVSIYALSGRLILGNAQSMEDEWAKLDAQVEAQEDRLLAAKPLELPAAYRTRIVQDGLCATEWPVKSAADRTAAAEATSPKTVAVALASPANTRSDAPISLTDSGQPNLISAHEMHLCAESRKLLLNLFNVTMHLKTWNSVVTERIGEGRWGVPVAPLFGISQKTIAEYAGDQNGRLCEQVAPAVYSTDSGTEGCRKLLVTMLNGTHRVAQSILGGITDYFLPVCYGFLGAMAATLRSMRRKVDASLLSYTDRARLQQGLILGVLCGGIIGLFASYFGSADAASNLSVSAFALLAGYNVDAVFRFLDELSDRLFRPSPAGKP